MSEKTIQVDDSVMYTFPCPRKDGPKYLKGLVKSVREKEIVIEGFRKDLNDYFILPVGIENFSHIKVLPIKIIIPPRPVVEIPHIFEHVKPKKVEVKEVKKSDTRKTKVVEELSKDKVQHLINKKNKKG